MTEERMIVPSKEPDWMPLSRTPSGRLFRKHILNKGDLIHPKSGVKIAVDDEFVSTVKKNFDNKVCDIVQVPLAGKNNEHDESPDRNIGEVIDITEEGDKVYAIIDVRDDTAAPKLGKTILGASAMLSLDYVDSRSGKKAGPTLLHVCGTNRPYVLGLEDYEEIVAASVDSGDSEIAVFTEANKEEGVTARDLIDSQASKVAVALASDKEAAPAKEKEPAVATDSTPKITELDPDLIKNIAAALILEQSKQKESTVESTDSTVSKDVSTGKEDIKEPEMTLEELLATLKEEHSIDVSALQTEVKTLKATSEAVPALQEQVNTLQAQAEEVPALKEKVTELAEQAKLSATLTKALEDSGVVQLSAPGEEITEEDIVGAVAELAQDNKSRGEEIVTLTSRLDKLEEERAEVRVQSLIDTGYILPSKKEVMTKLCLETPSVFEAILPEQPYVKLSVERGVDPPSDEKHKSDIDAEIERIVSSSAAKYVTK